MGVDINGNQFYLPTAGLGSVGSYQMSAVPWVTSSLAVPALSSATPLEVNFPYVTKFFVVKNLTANKLRVGFSQNGVLNTNYFILSNLESFEGELRVTKLYLLGHVGATTACIIAGLTGISSQQLPSNWSGSSGIG